MHDGSQLFLRKVAEDYNPQDKISAMRPAARDGAPRRVSPPACIYIEPDKDDFIDTLNLVGRAAGVPADRAAPGRTSRAR
jgi:hypothetical protein